MRRRAFWGIVGLVTITLTAGVLAAAVLINRSVENSVRVEFARQAQATAGLIETVPISLMGARRDELAGLLRVSAAVGGHDYVQAAVVGPDGEMIVLGTESSLLEQAPLDLGRRGRRVEFEARIEGENVAAYLIPVRVGTSTVMIAIGTDLEIVPWNDVLLRFGWALGLAVLLAALLAGWLARFLSRRLDGLHSASRRVAAGDLAARVDVGGDDEVGEVEVAFNDMAGQLQEARRREREFLVSVGHDLRTPLTTIGGYAEALEEGRITDEDMPRVAGVIHRESGRLQRLVEDLMLLARIEAREFSLRPEEVDLAAHLKEVAEAFRGRADSAGVELEIAVESVESAVIDPDRIAQVVGNLMENALRYTPEGGWVRLGLEAAGGHARITVSDTGPGIESDDLPHIFERLYVTKRYRPVRPEGSGLGLAIVKELVDAMAGTTEVIGDGEAGTTVVVTVPLAPPPGAAR